ncbi:hypothetical protein [Levilactobacillus zymae]|uniref:hypothetical protein n=1 Tax=Levilactobacillus zymae TaxID=267363 RepID=UPI0028B3D2EE|nr:hypothetical protein [Levilactobacillus zymae]MDT6980650.1 hypothetical protein [Levilactobacillus zymae]
MQLKLTLAGLGLLGGLLGLTVSAVPTAVQAATWRTGTPTKARGTWRYRQGKKHYTVRIKKTGLRFVNNGHTGTQGRSARYRYLGDHTYLVKERTAHTKKFRQTTFKLKGGALYVLGRKYQRVAH